MAIWAKSAVPSHCGIAGHRSLRQIQQTNPMAIWAIFAELPGRRSGLGQPSTRKRRNKAISDIANRRAGLSCVHARTARTRVGRRTAREGRWPTRRHGQAPGLCRPDRSDDGAEGHRRSGLATATRRPSACLTRPIAPIRMSAWLERARLRLPETPASDRPEERGRTMFRVDAKKPVHFCDGLTPPRFPARRVADGARPGPAGDAGAGGVGGGRAGSRRQLHPAVPGRRAVAARHLGHEARGARGDPRAVPADRRPRCRASRSRRSSRGWRR